MLDSKLYFKKLDKQFSKDLHEFIDLIPRCKQFTADQIKVIYKALYKAIYLHQGQVRKNGEPYVNHPIAAASILAIYGLDYETVCATLLHDTYEDTCYTFDECVHEFGSTIASLVDWVTKIRTGVNWPTHEKILRGAENDVRVIAVKLGDRLHNMHTLSALNPEKRFKIATETNDFYVPITKILGIYSLKDELQDLCLFYLNNDEFLRYYELRCDLKKKHNEYLDEFGSKVQEELSKKGIGMRFNHRVKNVGGIYSEVKDGKKADEVDDLLAIKMIVKEPSTCYETLDVINDLASPLLKEPDDFIANPKSNGYKSLNTNVRYNDRLIQARIRTESMQKTNDLGVFTDLNDTMQKNVTEQMKKELGKLVKKR